MGKQGYIIIATSRATCRPDAYYTWADNSQQAVNNIARIHPDLCSIQYVAKTVEDWFSPFDL